MAPDWIPFGSGRAADPRELAATLLADPAVTGLTFSGGEPMHQAAGLAQVITAARQQRDLSLICFTGYRLAELQRRPPGPGAADLLAQVDVLIDGRYIAGRNDGIGLRGSSNQQVHFLTERLRRWEADLTGAPRRAEIRIRSGAALLVGVPGPGIAEAFDRGVEQAADAGRLDFAPGPRRPPARDKHLSTGPTR